MKRNDLPKVQRHVGNVTRLEAAVKAIVHTGGEPCLIIRKGTNDIETGVPVCTDNILKMLLDDIEAEWKVLVEVYHMERSPSEEPSVEGSLTAARSKLAKPNPEGDV